MKEQETDEAIGMSSCCICRFKDLSAGPRNPRAHRGGSGTPLAGVL